jgi:hypothetical protein
MIQIYSKYNISSESLTGFLMEAADASNPLRRMTIFALCQLATTSARRELSHLF